MERILLERRVESPFKGQQFDFVERSVVFASHFYEMEEINGFIIYFQPLSVFDKLGRSASSQIYLILPNKSNRWFAFRRYSSAVDFCRIYINAHTDSFWLKNWSTYLSVVGVADTASSLVPTVAFTQPDDDLPF